MVSIVQNSSENRRVKKVVEANRPRLMGLVYRITGSSSEAEDIVNETFFRYSQHLNEDIENPAAWMTRVASNLAYDHLKSAKVTRESYIGPWLPEPLIENHETPSGKFEREQNISIALMLLLEKLSPKERVAYILHDLFSFSFKEISEITADTELSCRKSASRARQAITKTHVKQKVDQEKQKHFAKAFFSAVRDGNTEALFNMLTTDTVFISDGGGKAAAAEEILIGPQQIAAFLFERVSAAFKALVENDNALEFAEYNQQLGMLIKANDKIITAFQFDIVDGKITAIYAHRNPEKLKLFDNAPL